MSNRYPGGVVRKNQKVPAANGASGVWNIEQASQATKSDIWPYSGIANPISQSLRIRSSADAGFSRATATGNRTTYTLSFWAKFDYNAGAGYREFIYEQTDTYKFLNLFQYLGSLRFFGRDLVNGTIINYTVTTDSLFRDPSAWYHIVFSIDTTQATSTNRVKIYVNGVQQPLTATNDGYPPQNWSSYLNVSGSTTYMFRSGGGDNYDGYVTDMNFVDGQALTPSSFGRTNEITGVWEPKLYSGTYGTNGFHLEFKDTDVGKDTSGNRNYWTPTGISTTAGTTYDLMTDVPVQFTPGSGANPRGNYCTLNSIDAYDNAPTQGNLARIGVGHTGSPWSTCRGTMGVTSGKWYFEATLTGSSGSYQSNSMVGVMTAATSALNDAYGGSTSRSYQANGGLQGDNSTGSASSAVSGDVIMCAFDIDAGKVWFGKNGTWFNSGVPASGTGNVFTSVPASPVVPAVHMYGNTGDNNGWYLNFGQRSFTYAPPTGYKALCTTNLPTPTIGATTATDANKYFDISLYTGNGTTQSITNNGQFQPDFVWIKSRSSARKHNLYDTIRGVGKELYSHLTDVETDAPDSLTSFNSNGFSLGNDGGSNYSGATFIGWQWNAGGANTTNTSGTITSTVRANQTSGFSIVSYTGNGTSGATVGHGLGVAPKMIIVKGRSVNSNWPVWHSVTDGNNLFLNATDSASSTNYRFSGTPNSTTFGISSLNDVNTSSATYVAYCFAEIEGYSKFGSYTGNGSTNGPFVYCGFKPKFILIKRTDAAYNWVIFDTVRSTYNAVTKYLIPNLVGAEGDDGTGSGSWVIDFLSNGFKLRSEAENTTNTSGGTFIYMAFAENPFKNALAR